MNPSNAIIINAVVASGSVTSTVMNAGHVVSASFQIISSSNTNAGSVQAQWSNDPANTLLTDTSGNLIPVNWSNLGSAVTVTSGGLKTIEVPQSSYAGYRWLRVVWTPSAGAGTLTVNAFTIGF